MASNAEMINQQLKDTRWYVDYHREQLIKYQNIIDGLEYLLLMNATKEVADGQSNASV